MSSKVCSKCCEEKSLVEFSKDSHKKSGYRSYCKKCNSVISKIRYGKNRKKEIARSLKYNRDNPDKHSKHNRDYYRKNKEICLKRNNSYMKKKMQTDPNYRLKRLLRDRFRKALKNNYKNGSAVKDLGCSIEEFKIYLESKFINGMSWDGIFSGSIHIDHIRPLASFNLVNREELQTALHYTNLQPLWSKDNLKKGAKYDSSSN